jgi:DNA end-binding protein Ku
MRSNWTGAFRLGPLNIPVKLGSTVRDNQLGLHMVRKADGSRIRFTRVAEADGAEVDWEDTAKGWDAPDGSLVVLDNRDFEKAFGSKNRIGEILMFTDEANVPPLAAKTAYWVQPGTGGDRSYALLAGELQRTGKVGIITFAMRQRMAVGVLRPRDGYLSLEPLEWDADLVRPDFPAPAQTATRQEQDLTRALVEQATGKYDHSAQEDPSRTALAEVIQAKIEQGDVIAGPPRPDSAGAPQDLEAVLKAAVEAQKKNKGKKIPEAA